jgi:hypothetical protein
MYNRAKESSDMNIVIPLAGTDKNFERKGDHKALTKVYGKTVIEWIADSRPYDLSKATFVLLEEHDRRYRIADRLRAIFGTQLDIVWTRTATGGAPQSVLLCADRIDNDKSLIIDLPDQYIDFKGLMPFLRQTSADGVIPTFESLYYNRGYMLWDEITGCVTRVSEKDRVPISIHSTACVSYFKRGSDFVSAVRSMIVNQRTAANGAYLISLAFNELIATGKRVLPYPCEFIATLGSLEGLNCFEQIVRPVKYDLLRGSA